jgi:hypothetical protein
MDHPSDDQEQEARLFEARMEANELITTGVEVVNLVERIIGAELQEAAPQRDQTPLPDGVEISGAMERAVRSALHEVALGLDEDLTWHDVGLGDDAATLIEAGWEHKEAGEERTAANGPLFYSADPLANIAGQKEVTARLFDLDEEEVGDTEFDMTRRHASTREGVTLLDEPVPVGRIDYTGHVVSAEKEEAYSDGEVGTLMQIGTRANGQPIYLFDLPRHWEVDDDGGPMLGANERQKFIRPTAAQQMVAFAELTDFTEGGIATSSTYYPSRKLEQVRAAYAAVKEGRQVPRMEVLAYCPATLAEIKQEDRPAVPTLPNVLGEAQAYREKLAQLQAEINGE